MIGRVQVTRRRAGRAVLAVAVAAAAASVVYFGGQALGLGGDAPAAGQGDPPVLTISLPPICVTGQAQEGYGVRLFRNDDGEQDQEGYGPFYRLTDLETVFMAWTIAGGTPPFEVSVQGQSLLTDGIESGSTEVYCAQALSDLEPLDPNWPKNLANPSTIRPGPWVVNATVTDANGLSSSATAESYIVVDCSIYCNFDTYPPGHTYIIRDHLITIPVGLRIDATELALASSDCEGDGPGCEDRFGLIINGTGDGTIWITESGRYFGHSHSHGFSFADPSFADGAGQATGQATPPHRQVDKILALADSIGALPTGLAADPGARAADERGKEEQR